MVDADTLFTYSKMLHALGCEKEAEHYMKIGRGGYRKQRELDQGIK